MTPHDIVATCTQSGVVLAWDGLKIKASGEEHNVTQLLPILKTHKAELLAYFAEEAARDFYEERAAILEYDAGLSREEAEAQAFVQLQTWRYSRTYH
ncbi:MAG: hypothetical protein ACK5R5_02085 [Alphaproteobacteria bacterium]|jgi:hypothetical protein